jgi:acyl-CoA dehydrogenase
VVREDAGAALLARLDAAVGAGGEAAGPLRAVTEDLRRALGVVRADPYASTVVAGARDLALRMASALAAALLATWDDEMARLACGLWTRRWLQRRDVGAQAYEHCEALGA